MKQILIALLSGSLILTACAQRGTITPATVTQESSLTPSPIPTSTNTSLPTATPTASVTPLPTIPTFTPTFDASTIVTVTPAPRAECPQKDSSVVARFATPNSDGSYEPYRAPEVLDYLNAGGTLDGLPGSEFEEIADITGDGLYEIVYKGLFSYTIFGCKDGYYQDLFYFVGDLGANLAGVVDLNKNGIPELILYDISHYGGASIFVFEWDGNKFRSLIDMGRDTPTDPAIDRVYATSPHKMTDTNGDGLEEIVIMYDVQETESWGLGVGEFVTMRRPLRNITTILGWNGENFVDLKQGSYPPPQYRFQAVQDGDEQVRYGNYAASLSFYQAAIFDDRLDWWSPERREYEIHIHMPQFDATPTIYPTPVLDNTEYFRLAAYAYYRIMLLHFVQGHESDAGTVYKTLQQKFSDNPYGRPYFEMAATFWDAYQSTQKMYDGCAAAIQYATEHPEILIPLGSDYHGGYNHTYVPADVCPFR